MTPDPAAVAPSAPPSSVPLAVPASIATEHDANAGPARPRVVVVGAGFGGLLAAKTLADSPVDVVIIDRRNYHLFQPLLYQVATAKLSPAEIATPIRSIVSGQTNATVLLGEVTGVDRVNREVLIETADHDRHRLRFDWLVLATGARHAYFGHDEWEPDAPGLKTIEDATAIRHRLLMAFERAEVSLDEAERRRLLTIVVVGGGPTGVEMAGAIAELTKRALARDFRRIQPSSTRVLLIEAGSRILATFPEHLSKSAEEKLRGLGVETRTGQAVTLCDAEGVVVGGERIPAGTVIWGAGVQASPVARWLDLPPEQVDRAGRVLVSPDFSVPGQPSIFVVGDASFVKDAKGEVVPGVAPGAKQAGTYVAKLIAARVGGLAEPGPFRYRNWGNLATVGRNAAVADLGWLELRGTPAWYFWGLIHVGYLIDFRSRITVLVNWAWSLLTSRNGARLITGSDPAEAARGTAAPSTD